MIKRFAVVGAVLATLAGCATNPYTQRSQLILVSLSKEADLGEQSYRAALKDYHPSNETAKVEAVRRVADRIIESAKLSKYAETAQQLDWEVTVFDADDTQNAFALPGGKIGVFTGILPVARNEAGLAAILGHEVVHALARHSAERMSQGLAAELAALLADFALQVYGVNANVAKTAAGALGLGVQVGVLMPYSRAHESEADYVGLLLAAQAGYDPREAIHLWERMQQLDKDQQLTEYLSTHPSHATRIEQMQAWMPEALALYQPGTEGPAELPRLVDSQLAPMWQKKSAEAADDADATAATESRAFNP